MLNSTPIAIANAIDPILRDCLLAAVGFGSHTCVVLRHTINYADGTLRRIISDSTGILEDETFPMEHACSGCALREDALPTLQRLVDLGRWNAIAYAPPLGTDPLIVATGICGEERRGRSVIRGAHLATVATIAAADTLVNDILGDQALEEYSQEFEGDDRSVGECLANMIEYSDLVVLEGENSLASELLEHMLAPDVRTKHGAFSVEDCDLLDYAHDHDLALDRRDPEKVTARQETTPHFWSLELTSERPFHPERLVEHVEELGSGRLRARGCFWVPTRPSSICQWEGAGGQVSIGDVASFNDAESTELPATRLVITGDQPEDRARIEAAFHTILLTDAEWRGGLLPWLGISDGLDPWLGERQSAA